MDWGKVLTYAVGIPYLFICVSGLFYRWGQVWGFFLTFVFTFFGGFIGFPKEISQFMAVLVVIPHGLFLIWGNLFLNDNAIAAYRDGKEILKKAKNELIILESNGLKAGDKKYDETADDILNGYRIIGDAVRSLMSRDALPIDIEYAEICRSINEINKDKETAVILIDQNTSVNSLEVYNRLHSRKTEIEWALEAAQRYNIQQEVNNFVTSSSSSIKPFLVGALAGTIYSKLTNYDRL